MLCIRWFAIPIEFKAIRKQTWSKQFQAIQFSPQSKQFGKAMIQAIRSKFPNLSNTANTIRLKIRLGFRDLTLLNFDVELNEMCCSDRCLIFRFHVASLGGAVLTAMSQTLRGGNLEQKEKPPRSMSPPGQVFHLSVYSDRRWR